mgnify:FL=1|jgi:choline kinase
MLGICVPVRDTVHTSFAYCLAQMTSYLTRNSIQFNLYFENGSLIADQRYRLAEIATQQKCKEILWLDSDMVFPASVYRSLANHNKDAAACTYSTRTKPYRNVAFQSSDLTDTINHTSGLHKIYAVGMGIMLTKTEVFSTIPRPWFNTHWDQQTETFSGEDIYFCNQLQNYGYELYVDCDLSKQCGHIGSNTIKMENINV